MIVRWVRGSGPSCSLAEVGRVAEPAPVGFRELEARLLDLGLKRRQRQPVWIAGLFGYREPTGWAEGATQLSEDGHAIDHLAEHGDEEGDVKRLVVEGQ